MRKSLDDLLRELSGDSRASIRARNRCAFLDQWPEIKSALSAGWPLKVIWKVLRDNGRIAVGYPSILKYVAQQKKMESDAAPKEDASASAPRAGRKKKGGAATTTEPPPAWGVPQAAANNEKTAGRIPSFGESLDSDKKPFF